MKLQVGDFLLVVTSLHFEKAEIISVERVKGEGKSSQKVFTLNNQLKINSNLEVLSNNGLSLAKNRDKYTIKPFDQAEFDVMSAKSRYNKYLSDFQNLKKDLSDDDLVKVTAKLGKILEKYKVHSKGNFGGPEHDNNENE